MFDQAITGTIVTGSYDLGLAILSYIIAAFASFTALSLRESPFKKFQGLKVSSQKDFHSQEDGEMLKSESNPDKICDLKRWFAQSGQLSMRFNVHMGNLGSSVK